MAARTAGGTDNDPAEYLMRLGQSGDGPHDIAMAALMLAALDHPETPLGPYRAHLSEIAEAARTRAELAGNAEEAGAALSDVMSGRYGYDGNRTHYRDPANTDLIHVIDRRRGLPVALGILYIHAARAAGLPARGLLAPGHFLLDIELKRTTIVLDPFNGGASLDRERMSGPHGALEPGAFEPVSDIEVLLRLQNNAKLRALEAGKPQRGAEVLRRMCWIAPSRASLWLELARLEDAEESLIEARGAYEKAMARCQSGSGIYNEAALALHALKRRLN